MRGVFELDGLLSGDDRLARVMAIWREIARLDPVVAAWLEEPVAWRGPRPLCDARVAQLVEEARELLGV